MLAKEAAPRGSRKAKAPPAAAPSEAARPPPAGPAPAARTTVVLRPGPPPRRGRWMDAVVGAIGLLLLVGAGALAVVLPEEDILPPQFLVTFEEERIDLPRQSHDFDLTEAGRRHDFSYEVPHDNVVQIQFNVHFRDDLVASDPDRFQVQLYAPDGTPYGAPAVLANPMPRQNASAPGQYDAMDATATYTFGLLAQPEDLVVEGDLNATADGVAAEQERSNHFNTNGTWVVKVYLIDSGHCPSPSGTNPNPDDALRRAACLQANSARGPDAAQDAGNTFTVGSFSYARFTVHAERLE